MPPVGREPGRPVGPVRLPGATTVDITAQDSPTTTAPGQGGLSAYHRSMQATAWKRAAQAFPGHLEMRFCTAPMICQEEHRHPVGAMNAYLATFTSI